MTASALAGVGPIEPWVSLAWALAHAVGAGLLAMLATWIAIVLLIEIYDEWIGAPRPPAVWRRPWCWVVGGHAHTHARPAGARAGDAPLASSTCLRCGAAGAAEDRP